MFSKEEAFAEVIVELVRQEEAVAEADRNLNLARGMYELAAKRYAAVRDAVYAMLEANPYGDPTQIDAWPADPSNPGEPYFENPNFGQYQFLYKTVGEAVFEALECFPRPLTLNELVAKLRDGHLDTDARAVNASLLNMKGVEKSPDNTYRIAGRSFSDEITPDLDDLPF